MGRNPCYRPKIQHVPAQLCRLVPTGGSTTSASPPPAHVLGLRIGHRAGKQGPRASLIFRPHSRMSPPNGPRLTVLSSPTKFVRICFYGTLHPLSNLLSSRPLSLSLSRVCTRGHHYHPIRVPRTPSASGARGTRVSATRPPT
jgi:hypothetical protein